MPPLERVLELRDDALAEDITIEDGMTDWTESEVVAYFEAGGQAAQLPRGHPARSSLLTRVARSCYLISDVHVEHKANAAWLDTLPDGSGGAQAPGSVLLCCGDVRAAQEPNLCQLWRVPVDAPSLVAQVATRPELLRQALRAMTRAYEMVFFVPGNHDVWVGKSEPDSMHKYGQLLAVCEEEGVQTRPERLLAPDGRSLWIVPMASWYHASWDREPPLRAPPGMRLAIDPWKRHAASDESFCRWPPPLKNGTEELASAIDALNDAAGHGYAETIDAIRRERSDAAAAEGGAPPLVLSFSHMLPRQELMPEKRHLFTPTLHSIVGSSFLNARIEALRPMLHAFGHSHFAWDMTLPSGQTGDDPVRYVSWPLCMPHERARRVPYALDKAACKAWLPIKLWDAATGLTGELDDCYFSDLYKQRGRHPERHDSMAGYTAAIFCPEAPIDEMLPVARGEQTMEDLHASMSSLRGQVERAGGKPSDAVSRLAGMAGGMEI